jgi:cell division cycle protein 20 (cofactor of APC complex)
MPSSKMNTSSYDVADFENMIDTATAIKSSVPTRWERKARQAGGELQDRYIPNRSACDLSQFDDGEHPDLDTSMSTSDYAKLLAANTKHADCGGNVGADGGADGNGDKGARVLAFKNKAPAPKEGYQNSLKVLYSAQGGPKKAGEVAKPSRHIPSAPVRILDAPDMLDDYYLNLLSWSSTNVLAVALSQCVYLWDASTGGIKELMNVDSDPEDYVSSVAWIQQGGTHLAVGTNSNAVQLWDVQAQRQVRTMDGHSARVGALAWNNHILTSGSRDTTIVNHDVRVQNHIVGTMRTHTQEVCGLAWSPDGAYLASGANDNTLCIFDGANTMSQGAPAKYTLTDHQAAVKALAWSPHERNLLASGGGTADRCIKFWNAASGSLINSVDTGSQVCALQWSPLEKELLSSHGYAENNLTLWKYPTMVRTKELRGHTSRVLHMATSPDGSLVCSGAADETLRFWNIFASEVGVWTTRGSGPEPLLTSSRVLYLCRASAARTPRQARRRAWAAPLEAACASAKSPPVVWAQFFVHLGPPYTHSLPRARGCLTWCICSFFAFDLVP